MTGAGVESATLLELLSSRCKRVHPLFVSCGFGWENAELAHLHDLCAIFENTKVAPPTVLEIPLTETYGEHWSLSGSEIPSEDTPDEAVYLPGRNLILLSQAAVWASLRKIKYLALGSLSTNPFPDATEEFFSLFEKLAHSGLSTPIKVLRPMRTMHKEEVVKMASRKTMASSFSCIAPVLEQNCYNHCGRSNKCHERIMAFSDAKLEDPTVYADSRKSPKSTATS